MALTGVTSRTWAWASAGIAALTTAAYLAVIAAEGNDTFAEVAPWAALMMVGATVAAGAAIAPPGGRQRALATAAMVVLGVIGLISLLSVGMGFLAAAAAAGVAVVATGTGPGRTPRSG